MDANELTGPDPLPGPRPVAGPAPLGKAAGVSRRGFLVGGAAAAVEAWATSPRSRPDDSGRTAPEPADPPGPDPGAAPGTEPSTDTARRCTDPTGLMVGLLDDPLGVGSARPRLWWQVPVLPGASGGLQSGYEIELTRDPRGFVPGAAVESTGRVHSPESTAVAWPFAPLAPRTHAFWRVRTRHGPSQHPSRWSHPQRVVTGPVDDWAGAASIWAPPAPPGPVDATLHATVTIRELRAGIFLRTAEDLRNGYMWQLVAATATTGSLLRPHVLSSGSYSVLAEVALPVALTAGQPFRLTIECAGGTITTSIDGQTVDSRVDTRFGTGWFGVRTGNSESFWIDDVAVTDGAGTSLYASSFSTPADAPFFGSLDGGQLLVGRATSGLLGATGPDLWALLRTEFDLPPGRIARAVLHCAAGSPDGARQFVYRGWCNGEHLGVGPVRSADVPRYQTHDVTALLRAGTRNALAFCCWTRSGKTFQALLDVYHADGRRTTIVSDGSWRARRGGTWLPWAGDFSTAPYYSAPDEPYDARFEPVGWREPGYTGDDFGDPVVGAAVTGLAPAGTVAIARPVGQPVALRQSAPGHWIVDTGREIVGGLRLSVEVPEALAGTTVRVLLGEELNADGSVRYQSRAQTTYDERWSLRAGKQVIEHWGYRGFRFAELVTVPELDLSGAVTPLEHVAPEPDTVGSFTCSNQDLNRVWELCAYTLHKNRQDLFMDTPTRERGAYEGDLLSHARGQMALARSYDIGRLTARYLVRRPQWPTEYKFMAIAAAWEEYLETGDPDALDADFESHAALQSDARGWLSAAGLVEKNPGTGSQDNADIVDWPTSQRDGYVFTTVNTVVNAWQYQGFRCLSRAAATTGRTAEADRYAALADTLRSALNQQCFDPTTGGYRDGPTTTHAAQHAAMYAAALGVADDANLPAIARWLTSDPANPVRVSASAVLWLLEALYRGGRADAALEIMTSRRASSWLAMMEQWGATMTMEAWSPTVKSNTTFSHPWAAGPASVIPRYLLGVVVTAPGAASVRVAPAPAGLDSASGTVATVRGLVSIDLEQRPGYRIAVDLPGNVTGTLYWPTRGVALGDFAISAPHRRPAAHVEGGSLIVDLAPGRTEVTLRS